MAVETRIGDCLIRDLDDTPTTAKRTRNRLIELGQTDERAEAASLIAPGIRVDDHRAGMRLSLAGREAVDEHDRIAMELLTALHEIDVLATRGDRLELSKIILRGLADHGGEVEVVYLAINEVDADGVLVARAIFDESDVGGALVDLNARYEAGEAAEPR